MKSKVTDPEFLAQLTSTAYKSRLETDLNNLQELPHGSEESKQTFFLDTEHVFYGDKAGEPLLVLGLTPVWKDYIKDQVKTKKNPNFATGICYAGLAQSLHFEISKGKAKPAAIEKSFKKNSLLKKYALHFTVVADEDDALSDSEQLFGKTKPTDKSGKEILEAIKKEMAIFRQTPTSEPKARLESSDKLRLLIDQWQVKHPQPAGNDVAVAQQLDKLEKELVGLANTATTKGNLPELFADIVTEFKDVQNMDWNNMSEEDTKLAKKECDEVLIAVQKYETEANQQEFSQELQAHKTKVAQIKLKAQELWNKAEQKLRDKDFIRASVLMSPAAFLQEAGIGLKDDSDFANLVNELEAIQSETDRNGLTLDGRIAAANKTMRSDQDFAAITQAIENKMTRLRQLATDANTWLTKVGNAPSLIKALDKSAKERNDRKKAAIDTLLKNIKQEIENTQYSKTLASKSVAKVGAHAIVAKNTLDKTAPIQQKLDTIKLQNPNFSHEQLADAYRNGLQNGTDIDYQEALFVLKCKNPQQPASKQEKTDALLDTFDVSVRRFLAAETNRVQTDRNRLIQEGRNPDEAKPMDKVAFAFRNNTLFTAAAAEFFNEVDDAMAAEVLENIEVLAQNEGKLLEIDPDKEPSGEKRTENARILNKILKGILTQFQGKQAAARCNPDIKNFCKGLYQKCAAQNVPVAQIIELVGSTIVLRYINPLIGKMISSFAGKNNQRGLMIISKALQNAVNRIVVSEKEPFMDVFTPTIREFLLGFELYTKGILDILTQQEDADAVRLDELTAKNGGAKEKQTYLETYNGDYLMRILQTPNSDAYRLFYAFATKEYSTENLDYIQLHLSNQHRTLQTYRQYLNPDGDKEINVGTAFLKPFQELLSTKSYKTAPEQEIIQLLTDNRMDEAFTNVERAVQTNINDTWSRFYKNMPTADPETQRAFFSLL